MVKTYKGIYKPRNPKKYKGDASNIIYRSGWEADFMSYLDMHPDVLEWSSEEVVIPYLSPVDGRYHRYFPDFLIKTRNTKGEIEIQLVEIKPKKETKPPNVPKRKTRSFYESVRKWGINSSKWDAAIAYCKKKKWKFVVLTEDDLRKNK